MYINPVKIGELQSGSLEETIEAIKRLLPENEVLISTHEDTVYSLNESSLDVIERGWQRDGDNIEIKQGSICSSIDVLVDDVGRAFIVENWLSKSVDLISEGKSDEASELMALYVNTDVSEAYESILEDIQKTNWKVVETKLDDSVDIKLYESNQSGNEVYEYATIKGDVSDIILDLDKMKGHKVDKLERIASKAKQLLEYKEVNKKYKQTIHDEIVDAFNQIVTNTRAIL